MLSKALHHLSRTELHVSLPGRSEGVSRSVRFGDEFSDHVGFVDGF